MQQQQQRSNGDRTLSPTSNQLARWFSPELLAQGIYFISQSEYQFSDSYNGRLILNWQHFFFFFNFIHSICWKVTIVGCNASTQPGGIWTKHAFIYNRQQLNTQINNKSQTTNVKDIQNEKRRGSIESWKKKTHALTIKKKIDITINLIQKQHKSVCLSFLKLNYSIFFACHNCINLHLQWRVKIHTIRTNFSRTFYGL